MDPQRVLRWIERLLEELVVHRQSRNDLLDQESIQILPAVPPLNDIDGLVRTLPEPEVVGDAVECERIRPAVLGKRFETSCGVGSILAVKSDDMDECPVVLWMIRAQDLLLCCG